jgi:hypothetical protein
VHACLRLRFLPASVAPVWPNLCCGWLQLACADGLGCATWVRPMVSFSFSCLSRTFLQPRLLVTTVLLLQRSCWCHCMLPFCSGSVCIQQIVVFQSTAGWHARALLWQVKFYLWVLLLYWPVCMASRTSWQRRMYECSSFWLPPDEMCQQVTL